MRVASIASHPVHLKFVKNLLNASHSHELGEAAAEWEIWRTFKGRNCEWANCQFCNATVHHYLMLHNRENANYLLIGHDCYDKLRHLCRCGRVESPLPERRALETQNRRNWTAAIKRFGGDRTFLGWFREQAGKNLLPLDVAEVIRVIDRLGVIPTYREADLVIAYYKRFRLFNYRVLLDIPSGFTHRGLVPEELSLDSAEKLQPLIEANTASRAQRKLQRNEQEKLQLQARRAGFESVERYLRHCELERELFERQRREQQQEQQPKWEAFRDKIIRKCRNLRNSETCKQSQRWELLDFEHRNEGRKPSCWDPDEVQDEILNLKEEWKELRDSILNREEFEQELARLDGMVHAADAAFKKHAIRAGARGWHGRA